MKSSRFKVKSWFASMAIASVTMFASTSAHAVDGCKFLLCIAGPWTSIPACVSTVKQVFRDLARGRASHLRDERWRQRSRQCLGRSAFVPQHVPAI